MSLAYYDTACILVYYIHMGLLQNTYTNVLFLRHDFMSPEVIHGFRGIFFLLIQILFTGKNISKILVNLAAKAE